MYDPPGEGLTGFPTPSRDPVPTRFFEEPGPFFEEPGPFFAEPARFFAEPCRFFVEPGPFFEEPALRNPAVLCGTNPVNLFCWEMMFEE